MIPEETIKHTVKIDKYVSIDIQIPKIMTGAEFKAIMAKANTLFKLSDNDDMLSSVKVKRQRNSFVWPDKLAEELLKNYGKMPLKELKEKLNIENMKDTIIYSKMQKMRKGSY